MENNDTNIRNRRLLLTVGIVLFLVIIVLVWYFFYAKPIVAPSLSGTNNPLQKITNNPGFQFIKLWNTGNSTSVTEVSGPPSKPLVMIWGKPTTGQTFITKQVLVTINATGTEGTSTIVTKKTIRATSSVLLFVDKTTGYIYDYQLETGESFQLTNTIIPGVHDAYFFNNGRRVIMRYFDQEKDSIIGLIADVPLAEANGATFPLRNIQYLPDELLSVAVNAKNDEASYSVKTFSGINIFTATKDKGPQLISSSPFREWALSYGGNTLYATTKPSAYVEGTTVSLPNFQSEISEKTGLITVPGSNGLFMSSMWGNNGLVTFLSRDGITRVLPVLTVATKCSWGERSFLVCAVPRTIPLATEGLPDDWFQGRVSFVDDLVVIDGTTGERYTLYNFTDEDGEFDITRIIMTPNDDIFSFNKKQDGTLWLLDTNLLQGE